jgi:hypothetical protein
MFVFKTKAQLTFRRIALIGLMGQPIDQEALQSVLLTMEEVNRMAPPPAQQNTTAGAGGAMVTQPGA